MAMGLLAVKVVPGASRTECAGRHGDAVKIRLNAPPVDGKANDALIGFLADHIGVARSAVEIVSGHSARMKHVRIAGVAPLDAIRILESGKPKMSLVRSAFSEHLSGACTPPEP